MITFALAGLIFFLAGLIQGVTGFGAGLVAIPLLLLIIDVKIAVPLVMLNNVLMTSYLSFTFRSVMDWKKIYPLLVGTIPGIIIGSKCLAVIDAHLVRIFLGILLISYSLYNLFAQPRPLAMPKYIGYIAGLLTGFITGIVSAGGPPVIIYTTLTNWSKDQIKATLAGFFICNSTFTVMVNALSGMTTRLTLQYCVVTMPLIVLGAYLGSHLTDKINRRTYLKIIYTFLIIMGLLMLRS